jgi:predicted RNase H-like HicB family nuclease
MTGSPIEHAHSSVPAPVFNCVVHVVLPNADGIFVARVANLAGIEARGRSERAALSQVVAAFKAIVSNYHSRGEPIPFLDPPPKPGPGETERLIAVHL